MIDENYSSFTKTGPKKGNYKPDEPENHSKEIKKTKVAGNVALVHHGPCLSRVEY